MHMRVCVYVNLPKHIVFIFYNNKHKLMYTHIYIYAHTQIYLLIAIIMNIISTKLRHINLLYI